MQIASYKVPGFELRAIFAALGRMLLASVVMAEVVWIVARLVGDNSGAGAVLRVVAGTVAGAAAYVGLLLVLRAPELDQLRARFAPSRGT
jgi:hypothetical protein